MAMWHLIMGFTFGLVATIVTVALAGRQRIDAKQYHETEPSTELEDNCPICLENMSNSRIAFLPCAHAMHAKCLIELRKRQDKRCPLCRLHTS